MVTVSLGLMHVMDMEAHLEGTGESGVRAIPPIYAPTSFGLERIW
jgi:hypothetical protein